MFILSMTSTKGSMKTSHMMYGNQLRVCFILLKLKELYQQWEPCQHFPLVFMLPLVAFIVNLILLSTNYMMLKFFLTLSLTVEQCCCTACKHDQILIMIEMSVYMKSNYTLKTFQPAVKVSCLGFLKLIFQKFKYIFTFCSAHIFVAQDLWRNLPINEKLSLLAVTDINTCSKRTVTFLQTTKVCNPQIGPSDEQRNTLTIYNFVPYLYSLRPSVSNIRA